MKSNTQLAVEALASRTTFSCPLVVPVKTADGRPLGKPYTPKVSKDGYPQISFRSRRLGICMKVQVHQVVAFQKYGEVIFTPGVMCRHKNNNKEDFTQSNILVGTSRDNFNDNPQDVKDRSIEAAIKAARVTARQHRKLTSEQVIELRASSKSDTAEALRLGVASSTINRARRCVTYASL